MPLDEIEARLMALELLAIERLALEPAPVLARLHTRLVADLAGEMDADERIVRTQALHHVEDAQRRNLTFSADDLSDND